MVCLLIILAISSTASQGLYFYLNTNDGGVGGGGRCCRSCCYVPARTTGLDSDRQINLLPQSSPFYKNGILMARPGKLLLIFYILGTVQYYLNNHVCYYGMGTNCRAPEEGRFRGIKEGKRESLK